MDVDAAKKPLLGASATVRHSLCSRLFRCSCLASEKVDPEQDPFAYSTTEFHAPGHSWYSKAGSAKAKMIDEFGAMFLMGCPLAWVTASVLWSLGQFLNNIWHHNLNSMALVMFANTIIEFVIVFGACLMWYTMCYWSERAHSFWKIKFWPLPSLMPGGFMPRMAAFSLGLLMFTTSTLVSEGRVKGADLASKFHDDHWQYCRATDMAAVSAPWYGRILTRPPVISEGYHCFNAHFQTFRSHTTSMVRTQPFNASDVAPFFDANNVLDDNLHTSGMAAPAKNGTVMGTSVGFPMDMVVDYSMGHVNEADLPHFSFTCMYQCAKWKTVGLMAVIKNAGTIVAGSAVVVKTSDMISKRFGGRMFKCFSLKGCLIGLPLITPETDAETISKVIERTYALPGKGRSKLFAAFACLLATAPLRFSSKIDANGYYTVDYYVTAVFFSSLVMALVMRQWNPYKMMRIAYTEDLWLNGEDTFIDFKKHNHRKINLYEWIHLSHQDRADHLLGYARKLTMQDIKDELDNQKDFEKMEKRLQELRNLEEKGKLEEKEKLEKDNLELEIKTKFEKMQKNIAITCAEKCADDWQSLLSCTRLITEPSKEDVDANQYFNSYANLVVKTIEDISVVTNSPPISKIKAQQTGCDKGTIISKCVVIHESAVGTVLKKLDGQNIMVRFPRHCPKNAPTHSNKGKDGILDQYTLEMQPAMDTEKPDIEKTIGKWIRSGYEDLFMKNKNKRADEIAKCSTTNQDATVVDKSAEPATVVDKSAEQATNDKVIKKKDFTLEDCEFEDVVVSLEQLVEASQQWVIIQDEGVERKKEEPSSDA